MNEVLGHHDGESQKAETRQGFRQAFVVARQAAKTSHPTEAPFDNPAARQEHKALLSFWQLDEDQPRALLFRCLSGFLAGLSLIDKSDLDRMPGHLLYLFRQFSDLGSVLLVGRGDVQSQQMTQGVHRHVGFAPFFSAWHPHSQRVDRFPPSIAAFDCRKSPHSEFPCVLWPVV